MEEEEDVEVEVAEEEDEKKEEGEQEEAEEEEGGGGGGGGTDEIIVYRSNALNVFFVSSQPVLGVSCSLFRVKKISSMDRFTVGT